MTNAREYHMRGPQRSQKWRALLALLSWCWPWAVLLGVATCLPLLAWQVAWGGDTSTLAAAAAERAMAQGLQAFQRGDFGHAIAHWQEAVHLYAAHQHRHAQGTALTRIAAAYQALGQYRQALAPLQQAYELAQQTGDQTQIASVLASLGNLFIALGPPATAEQYLRQALQRARQEDQTELTAAIFNNLGNLFTAQNQPQEALSAYRESVTVARHGGHPTMLLTASTNAAMAALQAGHYPEAQRLLDEIWEQRQAFAPTHDTAERVSKLGLTYAALRPHLPQHSDALLLRAADAFATAASMAQSIGNARIASYAWGYLGHLYETEYRYAEALQLTRQAIAAAQQVYAPESLYRWQWQTGRVLHAQGETEAALAAYRQAIATVQTIRPELATSYGKPSTSFRDTIGALYFACIDLLLRHAATVQDPHRVESYLREARDTVELFKAAELRDYFQDECVDAAQSRRVPLDRLSQTAVIVYPILLQERTELLVSLPQGLKRFVVPVDAAHLTRVVRSFRQALQEGAEGRSLRHAQSLYDWLIRPLEPDLTAAAMTTVVFVPDGALRTIPMAALHDGQRFLIEKYAVALTPGLDLTDPQPLTRHNVQALAAGVTEAVQGFTALPHVADELTALQRLYPGTMLLNQQFRLSQMEQALRRTSFDIVHIASHGQFTSEVSQSFLLTFDDKLTMDDLGKFVGRLRFRQEPLALLTLSACETALGDDRAALGLAGIAIKAGARSAVATLWRVQDEAAALLVTEFYRQLTDSTVSRAVALQRAQLKLLADARYRSPFFWAPFLLINNWL